VPVGRCTHLIPDILMHTYFGFQIMDQRKLALNMYL
jgi:hypothetical protein